VKLDGDAPREFMSTAAATWYALDTLHTAYGNQRKDHPGQVARVKLTDVIETRTANATNFTPVFELAGWVARPPDLPKVQPTATNSDPRKSAKPTRTDGVKRGDLDDDIPY
jgi:hypothetical protein